MKVPDTVAILGLGLIGGSIARDLSSLGVRTLGFDRDFSVLREANAQGVVAEPLENSLAGLEKATLVVIATPVDAAIHLLRTTVSRLADSAVITDVGSVKRPIETEAVALGIGGRFVGSHPLAGDHRSGWFASRKGLFSGEPVFVCATTESEAAAIEAVESFWSVLGGRTERMDASVHDGRMAWISHLPQVAASALALAIGSAGLGKGDLGPGGRDTLRLAASSPDLWTAITTANADNLSDSVGRLEVTLREFRSALESGDFARLTDLFERARRWYS